MINLNNYILEKLHLDKSTDSKTVFYLKDIIDLMNDYIKEKGYNKWITIEKTGLIQVDMVINNPKEFNTKTNANILQISDDLCKIICDYTNDKNFIKSDKDVIPVPNKDDVTLMFKFYKVKDNTIKND